MEPVKQITIGVDIGQRVDPTAIAVVEREQRVEALTGPVEQALAAAGLRPPVLDPAAERRVWHHKARYLGRLPLGTPYPEVAQRLSTIAANVRPGPGAPRPLSGRHRGGATRG